MVEKRLDQTKRKDLFPDLPSNVDPLHVEDCKIALKRFLKKEHGDDLDAKRATVQRFVERVKNGNVPSDMTLANKVALLQVHLELKQKHPTP